MSQSHTQFLQIAIPVPMRQLFTYSVPEKFATHQFQPGERVIVPFGSRKVVGIVMTVLAECEIAPEKLKAIADTFSNHSLLPQPLLKLLSTCAKYYHHPIGDVFHQALPVLLRQVEDITIAPTIYWQCSTITEEHQESLTKLESKRTNKQWQLYQIISQHQQLSWPEIRTLGYSKSQLTALESKQLIHSVEQQAAEFQWQQHSLNLDDQLSLTAEQAVVVAAITQSLGKYSCHLIDGVTGSGKTEVYLQLMTQVLQKNQQVLVLVPEIGLTPQTLSRFEQRFNVPIFLHHSGLNDKERLATWQNAHQNKAAIVIGTRSAVFSPLAQLGLIIVDEEHDASFKQQDSFRYHGRDVAIIRAKQLAIPIVLGSATPSFETLQNAKAEKYHYHQLTKRAANSTQAKIALIDVSHQTLESGISTPLKNAISATLARGEQVLIFLNRRGYSPAINCQECHWIAECHRCQSPYTFHRGQGLLICHHCGSQKRVMPQCECCGSVRIKPIGQGTEQIEQYLQQTFADYSTTRIDRDSTRRKGTLNKVLQQILDKEHQLLIGTQMLAKGHHFPDVTLVAMLDIDGALFSFDYRAAENMAQLIVQVAGRAGRASKPGKVLVQTQYPQHPLLQDLVNNGYQHFAVQGLNERQLASLPPFGFQALFRAEANYPSYPEKFLRQLAQVRLNDCELAGPMPAAIEKRAGKFRFHLLLQAKNRHALHQAVQQLLAETTNNEWRSKVRWSIDVDPIELSW